jgi:HAD superfamily hydrolase (TIGR01509 family)
MISKVVFLDVGGTLVDPPDLFDAVTRKLSVKWPDQEVYDSVREIFQQIFQGWAAQEKFLNVEEMLALTLSRASREKGLPDISDLAASIYRDVFFERLRIFPETIAVLDGLQKNGIKMVVASDGDADLIEAQFSKFDLDKYFADRCLSGDVKAYKPAEGFTRHLLKHISAPGDCYFVGDNRADVESGRRLGIKCVFVDRRGAGNKFQADYCIGNLAELPAILGAKQPVLDEPENPV